MIQILCCFDFCLFALQKIDIAPKWICVKIIYKGFWKLIFFLEFLVYFVIQTLGENILNGGD